MQNKDFISAQKTLTKYVFIIGLAVCLVGTIIPIFLKNYVTTCVSGLTAIYAILGFLICYNKGYYSLYLKLMVVELSCFLFPFIMWISSYPAQAILYQFIIPVIWSIALSDKKYSSIGPICTGIALAAVDCYRITTIIGLSQGIEYTVIFVVLYFFLFYISNIYIKSAFEAYKKASDSSKIDYLTTAFNRLGIYNKMEELISSNKPFYLVYIDLDNFKNVNDTLGHEAGDQLLVDITYLWWQKLYEVPTWIGRIGGDEFVIIIETDNKETATSVVNKAISTIAESNNELLHTVTASAGIVAFPLDASTSQLLFMYADTAMYKAKSSGKNTYHFFSKDTYDEITDEFNIKARLEDALRNDSFNIVYQPQVDAKTKKVFGFESLIRLKGKQTTSVQHFIEVAEKSNLIYDLDRYVLDKVTRECSALVELNPDIIISVNISGKHLSFSSLVDEVKETLERNKFPAKNLCIEITESAFIKSLATAKNNIVKLNELGIKWALDDFGMGYSSLAYLSELKVSHIKIEKYFVDTMLDKDDKGNLANIIINIGHLFKYKVIAEGVETVKQLDYLNERNCDIIQGYLYSKPVPLLEAKELCNKKFIIENKK